MTGMAGTTGSVIMLTVLYGGVTLLLIGLQLQSPWSWPVKAVTICTALPLFVATFVTLETMLGWPSDDDLPAAFQLHAALVDEPSTGDARAGAIYLWVTSLDIMDDQEVLDSDPMGAVETGSTPRAFALPYSRDLHNRVEAMREAMQKGKWVEGRHRLGSSLERRFGEQNGGIDFHAPSPPPPPSKEG